MAETSPLGKKIIATIRSVLRRCKEVGEKVDFPGEGGERRFRKWLASELLEGVLGWPVKNVVVGERFDALLLSDEDHALATIETKTPYHEASKNAADSGGPRATEKRRQTSGAYSFAGRGCQFSSGTKRRHRRP